MYGYATNEIMGDSVIYTWLDSADSLKWQPYTIVFVERRRAQIYLVTRGHRPLNVHAEHPPSSIVILTGICSLRQNISDDSTFE